MGKTRYILLVVLVLIMLMPSRLVQSGSVEVLVLVVEDPRTHAEDKEYLLRGFIDEVRHWLAQQCSREVFSYSISYIMPSPPLVGAADLWQWSWAYRENHPSAATYWVFGDTGGALLGAGTGMAVSGDWTLRLIYGSVPPFPGEGSYFEAVVLPFYQYRRAAAATQLVYTLAGGWGPTQAFDVIAWPNTELPVWYREKICQRF